MPNRKKLLVFSILLIIITGACILTGENTNEPDLALTITALVQSNGQQQQQQQPVAEPTSTPEIISPVEITSTPEFTATVELTATPEITSTSSIPIIMVSIDTNCRLGPGIAYKSLSALVIGKEAQIVGKNSSVPNYWVINNPTGSGTCWLWGEYATITGDTSNLQEYAVPPTPTPTISGPKPVKDLSLSKTCAFIINNDYKYDGTLTWKDQSDNEDGFNLYINDIFVTALPPNTTSYKIQAFVSNAGTQYILGVESFNAAGKGELKEIVFVCP